MTIRVMLQLWSILLFQDKSVKGYLFDNAYQLIDSLEIEFKPPKFKKIIGKVILNEKIYNP